jgi:GntR family transcriptional regulator
MKDLFLVLNQASPVPPYEQIGLQIRSLIASAQLLPGTLLPSVRQLANDLGVAPNTIVRAYKELERDGWVVTSLRKRTIVAWKSPVLSEEERRQRLEQAVSELLIIAHQLDVSSELLHSEIDRQLAILKAMELRA